MLIKTEFKIRDTSEEGARRSLAVLAAWQPPEGMTIQAFYSYSDGTGGFTITEVPDAAVVLRAVSAFTPWLEFTSAPILPIEEATAINMESIAFRDAVS